MKDLVLFVTGASRKNGIGRALIEEAIKRGAKKVYAVCVHGILSDPAIQRLNDSVIEKLVISDTIKIPEEKLARTDKIDIISVSDLLATAILNVYNGTSITHMFGES